MPRRPALLTQADVARALRAAQQAGAARVDVKPNGTISIFVAVPLEPEQEDLAEKVEVIL